MSLPGTTRFAGVLLLLTTIDSVTGSSSTVRLLATHCHQAEAGARCFHLYEKSDLTPWLGAYELCLELDQRLAVVPDRRIQAVVERFSAVELVGHGQPHAWIAGRRSDDAEWRTMDEILFEGPVSGGVFGNESCAVYRPIEKEFYAHSCREDTPYLNMFVCQYSANPGCLDASALKLSPYCYTVLGPTLSSPIRTWNGANQRCQELYPEGTLAYSYIYPESELVDFISHTLLQSGHSNVSVWVGIRRNPWVWITESPEGETVEIPFTYTNWWSQEGASVDERCAHLDLRQNAAWADKDCLVLSQYFVCEEDVDDTKDLQAIASVEERVTTAYQNEPAFIVIVVTICAALIILIVGANIWDRKTTRPKKKKDIYFGPEDNSSGDSSFSAAFSIENGADNADKSTISHINIGRINTMALKGNSMLLRDHETSSLAINPAYSSCSEQDPEENLKRSDAVSRRKDAEARASGSSTNTSLIQSTNYSDVSYGGRMQFKDAKTPKTTYA